MRKPVSEVEVGTPVRWVCDCGRNLKPLFLTAEDKFVGMSFGSVCEVEIVTEEEVTGFKSTMN